MPDIGKLPPFYDRVVEANNTLLDVDDFLSVMTEALCSETVDLKDRQPKAFVTVAEHCRTMVYEAQQKCRSAIDAMDAVAKA